MIIWHPWPKTNCVLKELKINVFDWSLILKIDHPQHNYFLIRDSLTIPTLISRRIEINHCFLTSIVDGSFDAPDILSKISFRIPTHQTRDHAFFRIPLHSTSYGQNHSLHRMLSIVNYNNNIF